MCIRDRYSPGLYSDVPYTQWYYRYVSPLSAAGIFDGYEDGSFRPESCVTAGEALKLILLAVGCQEQERVGAHWASGYLDYCLLYTSMALCRSIINEVSYKVSKATGVPVKRVDVYVDTMLID